MAIDADPIGGRAHPDDADAQRGEVRAGWRRDQHRRAGDRRAGLFLCRGQWPRHRGRGPPAIGTAVRAGRGGHGQWDEGFGPRARHRQFPGRIARRHASARLAPGRGRGRACHPAANSSGARARSGSPRWPERASAARSARGCGARPVSPRSAAAAGAPANRPAPVATAACGSQPALSFRRARAQRPECEARHSLRGGGRPNVSSRGSLCWPRKRVWRRLHSSRDGRPRECRADVTFLPLSPWGASLRRLRVDRSASRLQTGGRLRNGQRARILGASRARA